MPGTGCLDCVRACPSAGTLSLKTAGLSTLGWNASRLALVVGLAFAAVVVAAQVTGHWKSGLSEDEFSMFLRMIDAPGRVHPTL